jgi:hypothetical protein
MTDFAGVDQTAAPCQRKVSDLLESPNRIVAAGDHNAWKRQALARDWRSAIIRQRLRVGVSDRQWCVEVRRGSKQRPQDFAPGLQCPVNRDQTSDAMRNQNDRTINLTYDPFEIGDPGAAQPLVLVNLRNDMDRPSLLLQTLRQKRLPMIRHVVAQPANNHDRRQVCRNYGSRTPRLRSGTWDVPTPERARRIAMQIVRKYGGRR